MHNKILITGGAGFIGSHLADELLSKGYSVRALDNLNEQVHGPSGKRPPYLNPEVELIRGDVRDKRAVEKALEGVTAVFHLAAMVGVGQSMYQIREYTDVNNLGAATLLSALIERPVEKLIVASSMSVYGEGLYYDRNGNPSPECERKPEDLKAAQWEIPDGQGGNLIPAPTPENKKPCLSSIYALSKYDQEQMCLITGRAYNIPTVALRFFNAYGARQALSNPYTGVLAIFASRLLNDNPPLIFEDGLQLRDFVSVKDVAYACRLALENPTANGGVFNVGSGQKIAIKDVAEKLIRIMNKNIQPEITGKYRSGDIRHCFADLTRAKEILGYNPRINFDDGLAELAEWLEGQMAVDKVTEASYELASRGLTV